MKSSLPIGLALTLGALAACGDAPKENAAASQVEHPALVQAAIEARGAGFAREGELMYSFLGPAQHLQLKGGVRFISRADPNTTFDQQVEIALASDSLQRYQLEAEGSKNWFLLDDDVAWQKTPRMPRAQDYADGHAFLAEDAALRWLVLRFPAALISDPQTAESWTQAWQASEAAFLPRDFGMGGLEVTFDASGLPLQVDRVTGGEDGTEELREVLLEVQDWTLIADADNQARVYPRFWRWHREQWIIEETIETVEDRALYLDQAFRPADTDPRSFAVRRGPDGAMQRIPKDRFALVSRSLRVRMSQNRPEATEQGSLWRLWDGQDVSWALEVSEQAQGESVTTLDEHLCFLWSSSLPQRASAEEVRQRLIATAEENGLIVDGPLWWNAQTAGFEALLPVRRAD